MLWKIIIYIGNNKNRPGIQGIMALDFTIVSIELTIVAASPSLRKPVGVPREQFLESRMGFAKDTLVK